MLKPLVQLWKRHGSFAALPKQAEGFDLEQYLLRFNAQGDGITWRSATTGILLLGDSGSSKSTATLAQIQLAAMRANASLVVTTVKPGDKDYFAFLASLCGRAQGMRVLSITDCFNPIAFAVQSGQSSESIVSLLTLPMKRQQKQGGGGDAYWPAAAAQYVRHFVTIYRLAKVRLSYRLIAESFDQLPRTPKMARSERWQRCQLYQTLLAADQQPLDVAQRADLAAAAEWLLNTVPHTPERTRMSIASTFCAAVDPLLRGEVGVFLNGEQNTWSPQEVLAQPGIVVFDIPVQRWGTVGEILTRILLTSMQRAITQQDGSAVRHPTLIVCDEHQRLVDEDDAAFMQTARSRKASMVIASQCVSGYFAAFGDSRDPRGAAEAILSLPTVKIFAATSDPITQEWAAKVFGQTMQAQVQFGQAEGRRSPQHSTQPQSPDRSVSFSRQLQWEILPSAFGRLARGGPPYWVTENFCCVTGTVWKVSGRSSLKISFRQVLPG